MAKRSVRKMRSGLCMVLMMALVGACGKAPPVSPEPSAAASGYQGASERKPETLEAYAQELPGTAEKIYMVPVPDGKGGGFWMSSKEVTWDVYDHFIYGIGAEREVEAARTADTKAAEGNPDALARPSKPYVHPDRGYGHEGYAVISCSSKNAVAFTRWFSAKTGYEYRLPTEDEWERACLAGQSGPVGLPKGVAIDDYAWHDSNSNDTTHPVGMKAANALGLFDMLGNASEWTKGRDGDYVQKGGSFWDEADALGIGLREKYQSMWQMTDPQLPKSEWWLSDAPFAGLRIIRDFKDRSERR